MSLKLLDSLITEAYNQIRLRAAFGEFLGELTFSIEGFLHSGVHTTQALIMVDFIKEISSEV